MAASDGIQVLDQGVGYGIVVGIGGFFAIMMSVPFPIIIALKCKLTTLG
jgi:hypothetical protein